MAPRLRTILAASVPVFLVALLLTTVGIEERVQTARFRLTTPVVLAARFHEGPNPCLRYVEDGRIDPVATASVAARMVAADLDRSTADALALAWRWTRDAELAAHGQPPDTEYQGALLAELPLVDRAWLRTLGRARLVEAGPPPEAPALLDLAARAESKIPAEGRAVLRKLWESQPVPLVQPARAGLVEALERARTAR